MEKPYDIVVVGGGLAGFSAAITARRRGLKTVMVYPRIAKTVTSEAPVGVELLGIGQKTMAVYKEVAGCPPPYYTETYGFKFISPFGGTVVERVEEKPVGGTLMVTEAMAILLKRARLLGVDRRETAATDFLRRDGKVVGVETDEGESIEGRMVICACGYNPTLLKRLGLRAPEENLKVAQTVVRAKNPSKKNLVFSWFSGKTWAGPGGLGGFVMPITEERLVVATTATPGIEPLRLLDKVLDEHPVVSKEVTRLEEEPYRGVITVDLTDRSYGDGFLVVGDAAGHHRTLGGVGTMYALAFGQMAAEEAAKALEENDTSTSRLAAYERRWKADPAGQKLLQSIEYHRQIVKGVSDEKMEKAFATLAAKPLTGDFYVELAKLVIGGGP